MKTGVALFETVGRNAVRTETDKVNVNDIDELLAKRLHGRMVEADSLTFGSGSLRRTGIDLSLNKFGLLLLHPFPLLAGQFIGTHAIHRLCGEKWGALLLLAKESRTHAAKRLLTHAILRIPRVNLLFQVIRRSRGAERYSRNVLFLMLLQVLGQFRCLTDAYQQDTCRQRVQSTGVTDFQILLMEMPACTPFDLTDDISRCPAVRLVYRKNNPLRIIIYVSGEYQSIYIFLA